MGKLILWGAGTSRTIRPHWAMHELGLAYDKRPIQSRSGETLTAEYTALNPRQKIPLLQDGDFTIGESAATVVRSLGDKDSGTPQFTLYGLSPLVQTAGRGKLVVERLDVKGERYDVDLAAASVVRGKFYDFAKNGTALQPGGTYAMSLGARRTVFLVDQRAVSGAAPVIGRLVRLE